MKPNVRELSNEDLGRELGQAIGNAVDDGVDPGLGRPTVVSIVERAGAKAKVRQTRRVVGSVAASVALFAGVAVGWNAMNGETEGGLVAASPNDVDADAQVLPVPAAVLPADFSTGPAPRWTQVEAPPVLGLSMQATGDGRVVGLGWDEDSRRQQVFITSDGREWSQVATPELYDTTISASGDTWVLVGSPTEENFDAREIYVSTNGGTSWVQRPFLPEPAPSAGLSYTLLSRTVEGATGSGGVVVLAIQSLVSIDIEALLIVRGLLDPDEMVVAGSTTDTGTLSVDVVPRSSAEIGPTVQDVRTLSFSYEQLDLSPEEAVALTRGGRDTTDIYVSTGGDFELAHTANAWAGGLLGTASGFYITLFDDTSTVLLTSQDGRTWSEAANPPSSEAGLAGYNDQMWGVTRAADGSSVLWGSVDAGAWNLITELDGLSAVGPLALGPGGLALVAAPLSQSDVVEGLAAPERWVGWSANGSDWGWQDSADIFGTTGGSEISLVVGDGFVLARVEDFGPELGDPLVESSTQWFRAEVG